MKKILYLITIIVAVSSCIYDFDPVVVNETARLVVDGDIVIGGVSHFDIYYTQPLNDFKERAGFGKLWIESSSNKVYGSKTKDARTFDIDTRGASASDKYRLTYVDRNSRSTYRTEWLEVIPAPEVTGFKFDMDDNDVYTKISIDGGEDVSYFKWKYDETWEFHADYYPFYTYNTSTRRVEELLKPDMSLYTCWATSSSTDFGIASAEGHEKNVLTDQLMAVIPRHSHKMTSMYRVDVSIAGMSRDSYIYHKNMQEISNMTGSLFTPSPNDMRGNIQNLNDPAEFVIGYVEAVQKSTSRHYIDAMANGIYKEVKTYSLVDPNHADVPITRWLEQGFSPVMKLKDSDGVEFIAWGPEPCIDCRMMFNGKLAKPSDWIR